MAHIVLRRQEWFAEYLRDQLTEPNPYVGRFTSSAAVKDVVRDMRGVLRLPENSTGCGSDLAAAHLFIARRSRKSAKRSLGQS